MLSNSKEKTGPVALWNIESLGKLTVEKILKHSIRWLIICSQLNLHFSTASRSVIMFSRRSEVAVQISFHGRVIKKKKQSIKVPLITRNTRTVVLMLLSSHPGHWDLSTKCFSPGKVVGCITVAPWWLVEARQFAPPPLSRAAVLERGSCSTAELPEPKRWFSSNRLSCNSSGKQTS